MKNFTIEIDCEEEDIPWLESRVMRGLGFWVVDGPNSKQIFVRGSRHDLQKTIELMGLDGDLEDYLIRE